MKNFIKSCSWLFIIGVAVIAITSNTAFTSNNGDYLPFPPDVENYFNTPEGKTAIEKNIQDINKEEDLKPADVGRYSPEEKTYEAKTRVANQFTANQAQKSAEEKKQIERPIIRYKQLAFAALNIAIAGLTIFPTTYCTNRQSNSYLFKAGSVFGAASFIGILCKAYNHLKGAWYYDDKPLMTDAAALIYSPLVVYSAIGGGKYALEKFALGAAQITELTKPFVHKWNAFIGKKKTPKS